MLVRTEINPKYAQPEIHVCGSELNDEVKKTYDELKSLYGNYLVGTDDRGNRCMLSISDIYTIFAQKQRVIVKTPTGDYTVTKKLYELEAELEGLGFVRISKSEIVSYKQIKRLDMNLTGTIRLILPCGYETYTSRRNVTTIKKLLAVK